MTGSAFTVEAIRAVVPDQRYAPSYDAAPDGRLLMLKDQTTATGSGLKRDSQLVARAAAPWQPDGAPPIARLGALTRDVDPVPETELAAIAPRGVSLHASGVPRNETAAAFC